MIDPDNDKDIKALHRVINRLKKRGIVIDICHDRIAVLDENIEADNCFDQKIDDLGGYG